MCGIVGLAGNHGTQARIAAMLASQEHRGPDYHNYWGDPKRGILLGHNRLSIIDLSSAGHQPMSDIGQRYWLVFNGEIYNYLELKVELEPHYSFRTGSDSEVLLASYSHWGSACLDRLIGMFAFAIWDCQEHRLFAARDRFGVKPFYFHADTRGNLSFASEIKALHAAGVPREPDLATWATYLGSGLYDHSPSTFWQDIHALPAGHFLSWHDQKMAIRPWFSLAEAVGDVLDSRSDDEVEAHYLSLLEETVRLRFRADVPVGINLSGGLDSSLLLALIHRTGMDQSKVSAFSFACGDPNYDEWPWVERMLNHTRHPAERVLLQAEDIPQLSSSVHAHQDEPFGGIPTLAYAKLFEHAKSAGVTVLLDGQGMDEQWAGYDYYQKLSDQQPVPTIQGSLHSPIRPQCLRPEFLNHGRAFTPALPFSSLLRNTQFRDICHTKIPRALRFNDRVSMRSSRELREPFLDHRLVILAMQQPSHRKIQGTTGKWFLRHIAEKIMPHRVVEAPKRPLQTPQREWLRGPLAPWVTRLMDRAANCVPEWLDRSAMQREWEAFLRKECDNSFFIWQWISIAEILASNESSSHV